MTKAAERLRDLIRSGEHFIAAEAYSALTGRIVEHVGFPAAYLGGHACSAFHYALPDFGVYSQIEQIEQAGRIARAMTIPLIADADTLGDTVADAFRLTRLYIQAGVAGLHVEDEGNPRHSTLDSGLIAVEDMQARLRACVAARDGEPFTIIARCDELYARTRRGGGGGSMAEAILRGRAYAEAGADVLVYPVASAEQIAEIQASVPVPLCVLGHPVPDTAFTLYTGWGWTGAAQLHLERARTIMETGRLDFDPSLEGKAGLLGEDVYDALIGDWATKTGRPVR